MRGGEGPPCPLLGGRGKPGVPRSGQDSQGCLCPWLSGGCSPHVNSIRTSLTGQEARRVPRSAPVFPSRGARTGPHGRGGDGGLASQREKASHQHSGSPFVPSALCLPRSPGTLTPHIPPFRLIPHPCLSHTFLRTVLVTNDGTPKSSELKHKRDTLWLVHLDPAVSDTAGPRGWDDLACLFSPSPSCALPPPALLPLLLSRSLSPAPPPPMHWPWGQG